MQYRSVKGYTGWAQLGVLAALIGVGIMLAGFVQLLIGSYGMGIPVGSNPSLLTDAFARPENAGYARWNQAIGTFFIMAVPAFFYVLLCHSRNSIWLGFSRHINLRQVVLGFFIMLLANYFADSLYQMSKFLLHYIPVLDAKAAEAEAAYNKQVALMSNMQQSGGGFFTAAILMALLPALFEELLFRGTLQNFFTRWWQQPLLAILVISFLFSYIHGSYYLFLSRFVLGFVLAWMFFRSKNIWVNIIAHALNNFFALIALFTGSRNANGTVDAAKLTETGIPWWVGIFALAGVVGLFYLFEKVSARNRLAIAQEEEILNEKALPFKEFLNNEKSRWV